MRTAERDRAELGDDVVRLAAKLRLEQAQPSVQRIAEHFGDERGARAKTVLAAIDDLLEVL